MKKVLFSIIAVLAACTFFACSNGDYNANPLSAANGSVNPFDQLDSAGFNWSGTDAISANVNGNYFNVDSTKTGFFLGSGGTNIITGYISPGRGFRFELNDVYATNIYPLGLNNVYRYMMYSDSIGSSAITYYSNLGNVGQVQILRNDPLRIIGKFHFQALNMANGTVINVSNGWFNIKKP
ncbi:hypothetical protein CJD36_020695 [Flavipsychrobacter stenotrophus]|uniref:Uncharacterized protein n=1 Tax=Flavipsychrobacter stenotrophus TaxID=2077091 RepID=A0A2S7SRG9_9BACT|nr:DUF6252 family protein [Flavipsychrobacter stenotrophus]PQJ09207.1 hypothetical protein CJD36_020695 [Flavipsychrobacter stenotrophus]